MSKKFLIEVDVRFVRHIIVTAGTQEEAVTIASTVSAESLALGEPNSDEASIEILGDEPAGHGSGTIQVVAEEGTKAWDKHFGATL